MFDHVHYVPVLRWKRAEKHALCELFRHGTDTTRLTPLIEIVPTAFDPQRSGKAKSVDDVLSQTADDILNYWGLDRVFVDLWLLPPEVRSINGRHPFETLGEHARQRQLSLIPVTGLDRSRDASYQSAVASLLRTDHLGGCIRLQLNDMQRSNLQSNLDRLLVNLNLSPEKVDLLVDCQIVANSSPDFASLCARIPYLHRWRTFTVASGNFPRDLTGFAVGLHKLERLDWLTWRDQVIGTSVVPRRPSYGDYTIQHPIYVEPPPGANPSASIRYTSDEHWLIMRGESVRNVGHKQYPALAQLLCELDEFCGANFSYGDSYIQERSLELEKPGGIKKPGSVETWLRAGINHHLAFVMHQIASLFGILAVDAL
jgi:hypothetical protein